MILISIRIFELEKEDMQKNNNIKANLPILWAAEIWLLIKLNSSYICSILV